MTERSSADRFRRSDAGNDGAPPEASSGLGRLGRLIAAAVGALLLVYLVIRVSAVNALLESGPDVAALVSREYPEAQLGNAFDQLQRSGEVDDQTAQAAVRAFDRAPMSEVPFLIGAREALAQGDAARADRLIATAIGRNPRSRYGLLLQLDRDLQSGRSGEAAVKMAVLTRLYSEVGPLLVSQLARMAASPQTQTAVRHVMDSDPRIRDQVLAQLARRSADPAAILSLAGSQASGIRGREAPEWLRIMLDDLVERGEVAQARRVWLRVTGVGADAGAIYDPDFAGLPGPPPFNWRFEVNPDGFAERAGGSGGLRAEYYGRSNARLAGQLLLLPPGRYRIGFTAEGQAEGEDSRLAWAVLCQAGDRPLVEVPITGVDFTTRSFAGEFAVPGSGCSSQWLRLIGTAAEFPKQQQVTIRQLRIERSGG